MFRLLLTSLLSLSFTFCELGYFLPNIIIIFYNIVTGNDKESIFPHFLSTVLPDSKEKQKLFTAVVLTYLPLLLGRQ